MKALQNAPWWGKLLLLLVAVLALAIFGWSLTCAFITCSDKSGWLSLAITSLGLPLLAWQLYRLNESIEKALRKPQLAFGLAKHRDGDSEADANSPVSSKLTLESGRANARFWLVVENHGEVPLKYVKIRLKLSPNPQRRSLLNPDHPYQDRRFEQMAVGDFVFRGGEEWIIYPDDAESFEFQLSAAEGLESGTDVLQCTAWAEGLRPHIEEDLMITLAPTTP